MACFVVSMALAMVITTFRKKFPARYRIGWLNLMLWGGVVMLAVEHIAHQEIVPYPPFLTAGAAEIIPEMLAVGVPMTACIVAVWGAIVVVSSIVPRVTVTTG